MTSPDDVAGALKELREITANEGKGHPSTVPAEEMAAFLAMSDADKNELLYRIMRVMYFHINCLSSQV